MWTCTALLSQCKNVAKSFAAHACPSSCRFDCLQDAVGDLLGGMAGPGIRATNGRRQRIMQSRGTRALGESQAVAAIAAGPAASSSQHRYYMQRVTAFGLPHGLAPVHRQLLSNKSPWLLVKPEHVAVSA